MDPKYYVIVGGSHGIGFGIAQRLAHEGNRVLIVSRTEGTWDENPNVDHLRADVTDADFSISDLPEKIHGIAYCPGSIRLGPVRGLKPESLVEDFQLNVVGAVRSLQACLPGMKNAGTASMILFSTVAVAQGMPMHASVSAVKGALEGLTRSLAAELAPHVRVNCIAPSLTDTPLAEKLLANDQKRDAMAARHPLKRIGSVDDVAAMAEFLLSEDSGWITGQIIGVDGGLASLRV